MSTSTPQGARLLLARAAVASLLLGAMPGCGDESYGSHQRPGSAAPLSSLSPDEVLDDLHERTFRFFWETTNPDNGLVPDRWPTPSFSSIAAIGFGLTAYGIGVERGYISREDAVLRVLTTLRFFARAPQGPEPEGTTGFHGFFYHFLDMESGTRFEQVELSTVDTSLLLGGVLFCQSYFDRDNADEAEIRQLADEIYGRVDWTWAQVRPPAISHGWRPEQGFLPFDWRGYNEAMLVYILALGSPTHPVEPAAWDEWTAFYDMQYLRFFGQKHLVFPPHFGHQYTHVWVDFRGIQDAFMAEKHLDYFENSRRATLAQRRYALENPEGWEEYGRNVWGLSACDGPANAVLEYKGELREFRSYSARGPIQFDDGTITPTAAASSIPFAPEVAIPAVVEMRNRFGEIIYDQYGFLDAFNPSFEFDDVPLAGGEVVPGFGWVDGDYLGIDQGPILAMIENHETEMVWTVMRRNPYIRAGLERAGFTGGWLAEGK